MALRIPNTHKGGYSNIDFRTNQDRDALRLFQPWHEAEDYGTMGYDHHTQLPHIKRGILKSSASFCSLYEKENGVPNSKVFNSCEFYLKNKIKAKFKAMANTGKRYAQLDEYKVGKDYFTGDSMMIADTYNKRKDWKELKKNKSTIFEKKGSAMKDYMKKMLDNKIHIKTEEDTVKIKEDKKVKEEPIKIVSNTLETGKTPAPADNKSEVMPPVTTKNIEIKPTSPEKPKSPLNKEDIVDLNKVNRVRALFKEKYRNRTHFFQIYRDLNFDGGMYIKPSVLRRIVDTLGVKINENEAAVLIASQHKDTPGKLDYNEFLQLLTEDPLKNQIPAEFNSKKDITTKEDLLKFQKKLNVNYVDTKHRDELCLFEEILKTRLVNFLHYLRLQNVNSNVINKKDFSAALKEAKFPQYYFDEGIIDNFYSKYPVNGNPDVVDFKRYLDSYLKDSSKNKNQFLTFQSFCLDKSKEKIDKTEVSLNQFHDKLNKTKESLPERFNQKILDPPANPYPKSEKEKLQEINANCLNSYQPSTEFLKRLYGKSMEFKLQRDEIERQYSPDVNDLLKYGTYKKAESQQYGNTKINHQPDPSCGMYMNEKERFKIRSLNDKVDFITKEKNDNALHRSFAERRKMHWDDVRGKNQYISDSTADFREEYTQLKKAKLFYDIEKRSQIRNFIME